tara:strand:+ start:144 stop:1322 length:1179 start_codon:yes stop_codon:yes gene_type:complete
MNKCLICGEDNPPSKRRQRKYCSKKCAKQYDNKKRYVSVAKEGYGEEYRKVKERTAALKSEYEQLTSDGWTDYRDLAQDLRLTVQGVYYRVKRCLTEGEHVRRAHDGSKGQVTKMISPVGVEMVLDYHNHMASEKKRKKAEYRKAYKQRPEVKERRKAYKKVYRQRQEVKERRKAYKETYRRRPEVKERRKVYRQRPEMKNRTRELRILNKYGSVDEYTRIKDAKSLASFNAEVAKRERMEKRKKIKEAKALQKRIRKENKTYSKNPISIYRRKQREDPKVRFRCSIGTSVHHALKRLNTTKGGGKTFSNLPYTPEQLFAHIESQFDEHMTWDNYGPYWALDHIIPQAALPYGSMKHPNFVKCWALENLQPLERGENARKSSYYEGKKYSWK